jgi:hypothetical protein
LRRKQMPSATKAWCCNAIHGPILLGVRQTVGFSKSYLRIVAVVVDCDITAVPIHIGMSFRLSWLLCLFKFSLYASSQSMAIGRHLHSLHSEWKCFETNDFCIPCETRHVGKDACTLGPCRFAMEQCNFFLSVLIFAQL